MAKYDIHKLLDDYFAKGSEHVSAEDIGWTHKICRELIDITVAPPALKVLVNALGHEGGGHTGEVTTMVLLPQVIDAVAPLPKNKLLHATAEDTLSTRMLSGKPDPLLQSRWTEDWNNESFPEFLPLPLQGMLAQEANLRIARENEKDLAFYPTGQGAGMSNDERKGTTVVYDMINDYIAAVERLNATLENY